MDAAQVTPNPIAGAVTIVFLVIPAFLADVDSYLSVIAKVASILSASIVGGYHLYKWVKATRRDG
jgi:hypothetical protein